MLEREGNIAGDVDDKTTDVGWSASDLVGKRACESRSYSLTYLVFKRAFQLPSCELMMAM